MVKQLIISIKNIMTKYINQIGSTQTVKDIIKHTWNVFVSIKRFSK
jgi:hypothetical protein